MTLDNTKNNDDRLRSALRLQGPPYLCACLTDKNPDTVTRLQLPTLYPTSDDQFLEQGVRVIREFLTPEEHDKVVAQILEKEQFVDSQSGRRKVDYGPKVNFKRKKIKPELCRVSIYFCLLLFTSILVRMSFVTRANPSIIAK